MMKNSIIIMCIAALISSCAALGKYKPVEEVPDGLYGDLVTSPAESSLANCRWQEIFTDPLLQKLIDTALVHNIDLQVAYEHIRQAEAQVLGARLAYVPSLGINPTFTAGFSEGSTSYDYNLAATASWQMSFFRLANNLQYAKAGAQQQQDYAQAVKSKLVASVANLYYTLLMLDSELETALDMQQAWAASVQTVTWMKEAGIADQVAVSQYKANFDKVSISVIDLKNQTSQAENAMSLLLGATSGLKIERGELAAQKLPEDIAVGIPVQMLTLRPDVRAAQRSLEMAHYTTRGAWLDFFPALSITGAAGLVDPGTGAISPMTALTSIGAGLAAPILNGGKNRANLKAAESLQREARLNFDQTLLTAGNEVNDAMKEYFSCREKAAFYLTQVANLDKAREDTEYLMKNSQDKTYLDVLFAYNNFFDAKLALTANRAKMMQAVVTLYSALGGGAL